MPAQLILERERPLLAEVPELVRLYCLAVMAFQMHVPDEECGALLEVCSLCREPWPCDQVRLAFRNLEGF